jgi:hypothetical protein
LQAFFAPIMTRLRADDVSCETANANFAAKPNDLSFTNRLFVM